MSQSNTKIKVAVIYGGKSSEHNVSCISAGAIMSRLDPTMYTVVPVGITQTGQWVPGTSDFTDLQTINGVLPEVTEPGETIALLLGNQSVSTDDTMEPLTERSEACISRGTLIYTSGPRSGELFAQVDVVLPVLHGKNGEDGTIQGLLELAGVPYVGNGVLASAAGMDKDFTKRIAQLAGIPVGREVILYPGESLTDEQKDYLGLPVFVKPARGGSSIGISKVNSWDECEEAVNLARENDNKTIVESQLVGKEVECGVLQYPDGTITSSIPAVLSGTEDGEEGFYGFDTKYLDNLVTADIGSSLDPDITQEVQDLAEKTFRAMECEGLARVDFFVTENGPVLNEINTLPGFTPISMYPQMFAASGVPYQELLNILIQRALVAPR